MSGTSPQRPSMIDSRASGATKRMSAPRASCSPPPKATPCTAAMTGMGASCQAQATRCAALARDSASRAVRSPLAARRSPASSIAWNDVKSSPAQNARPSPESTTARTDGSAATARAASGIAANIAGSSAFIFSGRLSRTSATPSHTVIVTRSSDIPDLLLCVGWGTPASLRVRRAAYRAATCGARGAILHPPREGARPPTPEGAAPSGVRTVPCTISSSAAAA